jgi:hypothetical protein
MMMNLCFEKSIWLQKRPPLGKTHRMVQVLNSSSRRKTTSIVIFSFLVPSMFITFESQFLVIAKQVEGILGKEKLYGGWQFQ